MHHRDGHVVNYVNGQQMLRSTRKEALSIDLKARYPEQKAKTARTLTKDGCQQMIETTKQLTQWIEERLPETKPSTPSDVTSE